MPIKYDKTAKKGDTESHTDKSWAVLNIEFFI